MEKRRRQQSHDEEPEEQFEGRNKNAGKKFKTQNKERKFSQPRNTFEKKRPSFDNKRNGFRADKPAERNEGSQFKRLKLLYNDLMKKIEGDDAAIAKKKTPIVNEILPLISGVLNKV